MISVILIMAITYFGDKFLISKGFGQYNKPILFLAMIVFNKLCLLIGIYERSLFAIVYLLILFVLIKHLIRKKDLLEKLKRDLINNWFILFAILLIVALSSTNTYYSYSLSNDTIVSMSGGALGAQDPIGAMFSIANKSHLFAYLFMLKYLELYIHLEVLKQIGIKLKIQSKATIGIYLVLISLGMNIISINPLVEYSQILTGFTSPSSVMFLIAVPLLISLLLEFELTQKNLYSLSVLLLFIVVKGEFIYFVCASVVIKISSLLVVKCGKKILLFILLVEVILLAYDFTNHQFTSEQLFSLLGIANTGSNNFYSLPSYYVGPLINVWYYGQGKLAFSFLAIIVGYGLIKRENEKQAELLLASLLIINPLSIKILLNNGVLPSVSYNMNIMLYTMGCTFLVYLKLLDEFLIQLNGQKNRLLKYSLIACLSYGFMYIPYNKIENSVPLKSLGKHKVDNSDVYQLEDYQFTSDAKICLVQSNEFKASFRTSTENNYQLFKRMNSQYSYNYVKTKDECNDDDYIIYPKIIYDAYGGKKITKTNKVSLETSRYYIEGK